MDLQEIIVGNLYFLTATLAVASLATNNKVIDKIYKVVLFITLVVIWATSVYCLVAHH
jgi:hypothetical protein